MPTGSVSFLVSIYMWVTNFGHISILQNKGSTYMWIALYASIYNMFFRILCLKEGLYKLLPGNKCWQNSAA